MQPFFFSPRLNLRNRAQIYTEQQKGLRKNMEVNEGTKMKQTQIQLSDVIYNAANQTFEGLVSVSDGSRMKRYPCAIDAPITMSFEEATKGLEKQALRKHNTRHGLFSNVLHRRPAIRAGRASFDPQAWLEQLGMGSHKNAA